MGTNEAASELVTEKDDAPIVLPAYVDLWSQTSPVPSADPEVALFLHGPDRAPSVPNVLATRYASREMAALWRRIGHPVDLVVPDKLDHFDVANQLRDPTCALVDLQLNHMRSSFGGGRPSS